MKRAFLSFVLAMACIAASSQGLLDIYKKKEVILKEDLSFGNNDWKQVFYDIAATRDQGKDGKNKSIVIAPDGTIFMSHRSRHSISIFDKDGQYIRDFGQKGGKASDFIYMPTVIGIMDGRYVVTHAVDGRILLFDLTGKWVKTDRLDYMPLSTIVLSNGKIALFGHTSWKTKFRHFVAIRDVNTGTEKIIWDEFYPGPSPSAIVVTHKSGGMSSQSMPHTLPSSSRVQILPTPDGNLAIAFAETGEIKVYTPEGTFKKSFTVSAGERYTVTKEDRERNYSKIQEQIKNMEAMRENVPADKRARFDESLEQTKAQAGKLLDPNMYPEKLPVFSQVMFDSDTNLLVFAYTKESNQNSFSVYTYNQDGQQVAESTFKSDNFNLNFGTSKFRFHKGNIIGIQSLKDENSDVPIRLVKFSLSN